nr:MAG TPA: hypothetical protein [Caudoviricetes sp.]
MNKNTESSIAKYVSLTGLKAFYAKLKSAFAPVSHNHAAGEINSGTLPVARGGTGRSSALSAAKALGRGYGTCATAAATGAKTAALSGFVRQVGALAAVRFTYANTASGATLNINNTGAATIINCYTGLTISATDISAGMTALVIFSGSNWVLMNPAPAQQTSKT